jgi:hypothetical protein
MLLLSPNLPCWVNPTNDLISYYRPLKMATFFLVDFHLLFTYGYKENGQDVSFAYDRQEKIV